MSAHEQRQCHLHVVCSREYPCDVLRRADEAGGHVGQPRLGHLYRDVSHQESTPRARVWYTVGDDKPVSMQEQAENARRLHLCRGQIIMVRAMATMHSRNDDLCSLHHKICWSAQRACECDRAHTMQVPRNVACFFVQAHSRFRRKGLGVLGTMRRMCDRLLDAELAHG